MHPLPLLENTIFPVDKSHLSEKRPHLLLTPSKSRLATSQQAKLATSQQAPSRTAKLQQVKLQSVLLLLAT
jgi:hypothetical protein